MHLDYVVVTSVDRDDLPDGGAAHFAEAIRRLKEIPGLLVEVLTPDFQGDAEAVRTVGRAAPDVFANNIETVRRLTPAVRDGRAGYDQTLGVLARMKPEFPAVVTKSSIMVGLGESAAEVEEAMRDLRGRGRRGPDARAVPAPLGLAPAGGGVRHPGGVRRLRGLGRQLGFRYVASGPLVRSSYRAGELFMKGVIESRGRAGAAVTGGA